MPMVPHPHCDSPSFTPLPSFPSLDWDFLFRVRIRMGPFITRKRVFSAYLPLRAAEAKGDGDPPSNYLSSQVVSVGVGGLGLLHASPPGTCRVWSGIGWAAWGLGLSTPLRCLGQFTHLRAIFQVSCRLMMTSLYQLYLGHIFKIFFTTRKSGNLLFFLLDENKESAVITWLQEWGLRDRPAVLMP